MFRSSFVDSEQIKAERTQAMTGYQSPVVFPWNHILAAPGIAVVIGLLASYLPARHAAKISVLEAIGYE